MQIQFILSFFSSFLSFKFNSFCISRLFYPCFSSYSVLFFLHSPQHISSLLRTVSLLKGEVSPKQQCGLGGGGGGVESNFRNPSMPSVKVWADLDNPFKRSDYAKLCVSPSLDGTLPEYVISQVDNSPLTLYIDFYNFLFIFLGYQ